MARQSFENVNADDFGRVTATFIMPAFRVPDAERRTAPDETFRTDSLINTFRYSCQKISTKFVELAAYNGTFRDRVAH